MGFWRSCSAVTEDLPQGGLQACQVNRFGQMPDHARIVTGMDLVRYGVGCEGNNRNPGQAAFLLQLDHCPRGFKAVHVRHFAIH